MENETLTEFDRDALDRSADLDAQPIHLRRTSRLSFSFAHGLEHVRPEEARLPEGDEVAPETDVDRPRIDSDRRQERSDDELAAAQQSRDLVCREDAHLSRPFGQARRRRWPSIARASSSSSWRNARARRCSSLNASSVITPIVVISWSRRRGDHPTI